MTQQRVVVDFGDDAYGSFDQHQVQVEGAVAGAAGVVPAGLGRTKRTLADILTGGGQDAMALRQAPPPAPPAPAETSI